MNKHSKRIFIGLLLIANLLLITFYLFAKTSVDHVIQEAHLLGAYGATDAMMKAVMPLQITIFAVFTVLCLCSLTVLFWPASAKDYKKYRETGPYLISLVDFSSDSFVVEDNSKKFVTLNSAFIEIFGITEDEIIGKTGNYLIGKLRAATEKSTQRDRFLQNGVKQLDASSEQEFVLMCPTYRILLASIAPINDDDGMRVGRVWKFTDVTELRQLEEGLSQSQKMGSVGQMAAGVAHDFNNLLTGINGNLVIMEMELNSRKLDIPERKNLQIAIQAGLRAGDLVKQILNFSRSGVKEVSRFTTNEIVNEVKGIVRASLDPSISVEIELEEWLWDVNGDPGMLSQCLLNMVNNARDAMKSGGRISLRTANCEISKEQADEVKGARIGKFVRLTVEDNGDGMSPEVLENIFTPFYTTKEKGNGTGLGLATSSDIIKRLGGWINVKSKMEEGTRFDVFLPRGEENKSVSIVDGKIPKFDDLDKADAETILVVDDDDLVRNVALAFLKRLGYQTLVASNGIEALEVFERHQGAIDLVMLDLTMPKLSGQETFARLRAEFDFVPVLICSGYLLDLTVFKEEAGGCPEGFIQKPYQIETIAASLRDVLDDVVAA